MARSVEVLDSSNSFENQRTYVHGKEGPLDREQKSQEGLLSPQLGHRSNFRRCLLCVEAVVEALPRFWVQNLEYLAEHRPSSPEFTQSARQTKSNMARCHYLVAFVMQC